MNKKLMIPFILVISLLTLVHGVYEQDLLYYYGFDTNTGFIINDLQSSPEYLTLPSNNWTSGLLFNSTWTNNSGSVSLPFTFDGLGSTSTINFWINRTGSPDAFDKIAQLGADGLGNDGVIIRFTDASHIDYLVDGIVNSQDISSNLGEWEMVSVVTNSSTAQLFMNGTLVNTTILSGFSYGNSLSCLFAEGATCGSSFLNDVKFDEFSIWNRSLTSTEILSIYQNSSRGVMDIRLFNPPPNLFTLNQTLNFTTNLVNYSSSIVNSTLYIWSSNNSEFFTSNKSFSPNGDKYDLQYNVSSFQIGSYKWNILACYVNNNCNFAYNNRSFGWGFEIQNQSFVNNIYETDSQQFNITINVSSGIPTGNLWWNSIKQTGTVTSLGNNIYRISKTLDIPTSLGSKLHFWEIALSGLIGNTTTNTQTVSSVNLTVCGSSPQNVPYINFTYKNETSTAETTTAYIPSSSWTYYINGGTGLVNKTLSYALASESLSNAFCFSPTDRGVITDLVYSYDNAESQQRNFELNKYPLTNTTLAQTLYLLPTTDGLYSKFQVIDAVGDPISGVKLTITRTLGSSEITVTSASTDDSGFVTFFLNPDIVYTATTTKTGYDSITFTFTPTTDLRTITLGTGLSGIGNGTTIATGTNYTILPSNTTLINNTDYTFSFIVNSTETISLISMNITNSSGYQLLFSSNAGAGAVSGVLNTGLNDTFIGTYRISTSTETFTIRKKFIIGDFYVGDYSIYRQFSLFTGYGFSDFIRILIAISIMLGIMIYLSNNELIDSSESKIIVSLLLIWFFSIVGWLDTGLVVQSTNSGINRLGEISSQFGIAIISTGGALYLLLRRII